MPTIKLFNQIHLDRSEAFLLGHLALVVNGCGSYPSAMRALLAAALAIGNLHAAGIRSGESTMPSAPRKAVELPLYHRQLAFSLPHPELLLDPQVQRMVPQEFPSFRDYMEMVLHDPGWGYYAAGRVRFGAKAEGGDFETVPRELSPYFGGLVAERAFKMWRGMVDAGALAPGEPFSIAEFGGGDGCLGFDVLSHARALTPASGERHAFASQLRYIGYERSPQLRRLQAARNAAFGAGFQALPVDARDPLGSIKRESLKGLVLSNELPDAFGSHKLALTDEGTAEAAFVVPQIPRAVLGSPMDGSLRRRLLDEDARLRRNFAFSSGPIFLGRRSFKELMDFFAARPAEEYRRLIGALRFHETYLPVSLLPDLAAHLLRNADSYAYGLAHVLARTAVYVNLDAERYIAGVGRALKAGYVMTIDYGHGGLELLHQHERLRVYTAQRDGAQNDPYQDPSLRDITVDQDFAAMSRAGEDSGLRVSHFGPQADLQTSELTPDERHARAPALWQESLAKFRDTGSEFKVLVQQKKGTDPDFRFADPGAASGLPLFVGRLDQDAAAVLARLRGALAGGR